MDEEEYLDYCQDYIEYDPETNTYIDTYDYESAGLLKPEDCDNANPGRICCGCKFELLCTGFVGVDNITRPEIIS